MKKINLSSNCYVFLIRCDMKGNNMKRYKFYLSIMVLAAFIVFLLFAPHQNYLKTDVVNTFAAPSVAHLLGTDNLGRDVYSLLLAGGVRTLEVVGIATALSFVLGTFLGMLAGYYEGVFARILQFLSDFTMIIPSFVAALILSSLFGFHVVMAGLVFGVGQMGGYFNQACILTQGLKRREFIQSVKVLGLRDREILLFHIFPNLSRQLIIFMGNKAAVVVNLYAGLAFIGLGTDITNPDWGTLLYQYRSYLTTYPMLVLWPTLFIAVLTICFHVIFDSSETEKEDLTIYD